MIDVPATHYRQGNRDAYAFTMTLPEINATLPSRSDDSLNTIQGANRQLAPRHANNIQRYLKETDNWTLGSITLAIGPEAITYADGRLTVTPTADNPLRIIDGQLRRRAIANLRAACLYAECALRNQRQMFASPAEQKPIDQTPHLDFDSTDPFNYTARWATEELPLLSSRVNSDKNGAVGAPEEYLLNIGDVKGIVTILTLSFGGRVTHTRKRHYIQRIGDFQNGADHRRLLPPARRISVRIRGHLRRGRAQRSPAHTPRGHLSTGPAVPTTPDGKATPTRPRWPRNLER